MAQFVADLVVEIAHYNHHFGALPVDTIFFGGGTPNVVSKRDFSTIMTAIHSHFNVLPTAEITMEMNPGIHSVSKLEFFKRMGINRVSIGAQSFNDTVLTDYGRHHRVSDTLTFIQHIQDIGFATHSVDIIFGHRHHTELHAMDSLEQVLKLNIPHVALYGLAILKNTPFHTMGMTIDDDQQADQYDTIQGILNSSGYHQYEVSNYCVTDAECNHNIKYWTFKPTIGLGPGAHSFFNGYQYANRTKERWGTPPLATMATPNPEPVPLSLFLATRLRYLTPIFYHELLNHAPQSVCDSLIPKINESAKMGWMVADNESFQLSQRGCLLLDEIIGFLDIPS